MLILFCLVQDLDTEQLERGVLSESSDSEEDGPVGNWSNRLAGRMHGLDDEGSSESSGEDLPVFSGSGMDIDFA